MLNNKLDSKFLQLGLWLECNSHCAFCRNKETIMDKNFTEDKIDNIHRAIEIIKSLKKGEYDFLGIIGGEFFQGQITEDVAPHFIELAKLIKEKIDQGYLKQLFVATCLMGEHNYEEFQKYFGDYEKDQILICTSFNYFGQFNLQFTKENWNRNFELFLQNGYNLHIEIIATQANLEAIIDEKFDLLYWVQNNVRIDFLRPIDFCSQPKQNFPWFFPKRETFIKFMMFLEQHYPNMLDDLMSLKQRASHLHNFTANEEISRSEEFNEGEGKILDCGHSEIFKAYIDSDHCMACDILAMYKRNKYRSPDRDMKDE